MGQDDIPFRYGRIEEMDDTDDLEYWRNQSVERKFAETLRLVELACEIKGLGKDELRFQRLVTSLQRWKS